MLDQPAAPIEPTDPADSHADPTLAALIEAHAGKVSDKWSSYIAVYEDLFASRRHQPVRLLEIGVLNGGSLEIWAKYFSAARLILGCDNNPACASLRFDDPRVKLVIADACSNKGARQIAAHADELDIVVDDGSHNSPDIVRSFFRYFPKLANGGIYVVEDLHCSYWQDFEGGLYDPHSSMAFFKALADVLNRQHWGVANSASGFLASFSERYEAAMDESIFAEIHSIEFRNSLCIVAKRPAAENRLGHRVISGFDETIAGGHRQIDGSGPIVSDESGNPASRRPLTAEIAMRDEEIEGLRARVSLLAGEAERAGAALQRGQAEAERAEAELQRAEAELGRSRDMEAARAGQGREVVLHQHRFRLGFSINGASIAPREFARYVPVAEALKIFARSALYALKRRLQLFKGKPAFKANAPVQPLLGLAGPLSEQGILDLYDDAEVAHAAAKRPRDILWLPDAFDAVPDRWWAARLMVDLLRRRPDLRRRFPTALSDGANGGFAMWLKQTGAQAFRLPAGAAEAIDRAFARDLAAKPLQLLFYNDELRARQPLYLLPEGRRETCRYLFSAAAAGQLRLEAAWWFLLVAAQEPGARLVQTYQFTPDWQKRFPDGMSRFGRDRLAAWLGTTFSLTGQAADPRKWPRPLSDAEEIESAWLASKDWQKRFPQALADPGAAASLLSFLASGESGLAGEAGAWATGLDRPRVAQEVTRPGVNIFGHFSYPSGLRSSALSIASSLDAAGIRTALRDVRVEQAKDDPVHHRFSQPPLFDISILHIQPEPFFDTYLARSDSADLGRNPYRIGVWYWELDKIPPAWDQAAKGCDEFWAASSFIGRGLAERYRKPVNVFLPGLELPEFTALPRSRFGLPEHAFILLFAFHMTSVTERKNPLGLVSAFHKAFAGRDDAMLVIKTSFGSSLPTEFALLLEAAAADPRIRIIDAVYSDAEMLALMKACDAYVSLHRSEGLGLTLAEAMLLGKPTVATRYSGNLDFMDDGNSLLVDCTVGRLERTYPPYEAGMRWASPALDHAAALMRRLYEDRTFAHELGARAKRDLEGRMSFATAGKPMADRLREIAEHRRI